MSNPTSAEGSGGAATREQMMSAMFAHMVMQHTNMALIFLGHMPNPQTGQTSQDLEHARYFIDQLEMLEIKTKGNLDKQEETVLKQALTNLRLAFVEAVNHPQPGSTPPPAADEDEQPKDSANAPATDEQETPVAEPALPGEKQPPDAETPTAKKFSKKYS
jgi:hypothetical protein